MLRAYLFLVVAVMAEVIATTALARSDGFTRLWPSVITTVGYATAFGLLTVPLQVMPTGIVYAIWSGLGIVLIALVAWIWAKQSLDPAAQIGLALIVAGVAVINLFSTTVSH
jgi:small multidrug resistance pump